MKCLEDSEDRLAIMVSHDWPLGIYQHGNVQELLQKKPFFRAEVERNELGSLPNREILDAIKPKRWFSAHLHVKFEATVVHCASNTQPVSAANQTMELVPSQVSAKETADNSSDNATALLEETSKETTTKQEDSSQFQKETIFQSLESSNTCATPNLTEQMTKFLALDKCLPRRQYLSIVNIPKPSDEEAGRLEYDPEWLAIVRKTSHLTSTKKRRVKVPSERTRASKDEIDWVVRRITKENGDLRIPDNFCQTVPFQSHPMFDGQQRLRPFPLMGNPQTDRILSILEMEHTITVPFDTSQTLWNATQSAESIADENEIDIDSLSDVSNGKIRVQPDPASARSATIIEDENEIDLSSDNELGPNEELVSEMNETGLDRTIPALKKRRQAD
eukprot:scaffold22638_cov138-Cylindrotheca_fusiformis.AAC.2